LPAPSARFDPLSLGRVPRGRLIYNREILTGGEDSIVNVSYEPEKWIQSKWRKGTRFYRLDLCQNLWGNWVVRRTWGSAVLKDFGKSLDTECLDRDIALEIYGKLERRREKRGYKKIGLSPERITLPPNVEQ
jgi:hypothetical protein